MMETRSAGLRKGAKIWKENHVFKAQGFEFINLHYDSLLILFFNRHDLILSEIKILFLK